MYVDIIGSLFYLTATTFHFLFPHLLYEHGPLNQLYICEVEQLWEVTNKSCQIK